MNCTRLSAVAIVAFGGVLVTRSMADNAEHLAALRERLPTAGELLLGNTLDADRLRPTVARPDLAATSVVDAEGVTFERARRIQVRERGETPWDVQLRGPHSALPITKGDMLFVAYSARCVVAHDESGEGVIQLYLQSDGDTWTGLVQGRRRIGRDWQVCYAHAVADRDWAPGSVNLTFHLASLVQTLEIGGVVVLNLGQGVSPAELPVNRLTYAGRDAAAPWRIDAARRIEQHRKGDLLVEVVDGAGRPVRGAQVHVRMTRHAYGFGSFFDHRILDDDGAVKDTGDARIYADWFLKLFNKATTPVYWADWGWANPRSRADYHRRARWLQHHGVPARGHVLVWPAWRWLPKAVRELEDRPEDLRRTVRDHVTEVVAAMKPCDLIEYDVMNEPRVNHDLMDILGQEAMLDWWQAARDADGRQTLYINEYSIVTKGGHTASEQDSYAATIRYLLDNRAPLGGIGVQGHMGETMTAPAKIIAILDRFAAFGLPIQVTEFDLEIDDLGTQAAYTRDFYTAVFSHPATNGIVQWGFWEESHWKPRAAMFRKDWTLKPNAQAYIDLVLRDWWTDEIGRTDEQGRFALRGFCGDYEIRVDPGRERTTCTLGTDGTTVRIEQN